jgi:hypothetical protein
MDFLTRADRLHQEADVILKAIRFSEIFQPIGPPSFTGSYFLDLMAYPDIDVEVSQMTPGQIFSVLSQFFEHPWLDQVEFEKPNEPRLPGSLYFKLRIVHGDWGRPWKIDIWSLSHSQLASGRKEMQHIKNLITPGKREIILRYKAARLNAQGRTPPGSGWWIYKAVLEDGLEDPLEIDAYLIANGIKI